MDIERQVRSSGAAMSLDERHLNLTIKWMQVIFRFLAVLFEVATLAFLGYIYDGWRRVPSVRVDVVFPSFFPVTAAALVDMYEVLSLLLSKRKWLINPFVVGFDIVVTGVSIFCFLILGMTDYEGNQKSFAPGSPRSVWATDMNNGMIFMIVFCLLHAMFVILSSAGFVYRRVHRTRERKKQQIAQAQAEMVQFHERQRRQAELDAMRNISSRRGKPLAVTSAAANADSEQPRPEATWAGVGG